MIGIIGWVSHAVWIAAALYAFMAWRRLREVGHAWTVPMARLRPGMEVRVHGHLAFHGAARASPLGGEPSVWFEWKVERRDDQLRDPVLTGLWITEAAGMSSEPFAIVDDAGHRVLVWPANAEVLDSVQETWDGEYPEAIDGALRDRLLRGVDAGPLHFTERRLPLGAICFVTGLVEARAPEHGPDISGQIRVGGERAFLISAGTARDMFATLRRRTIYGAIVALVALVLAMGASIPA